MIPRLEKEREINRNHLIELMENLYMLEVGSPFKGNALFTADYAHHMHLLSNLIYTSITNQVHLDLIPHSIVGTRMLPPVGTFSEIIINTSH
jgi:hypothetical protein